jgi:hypothetical protein
MNVPSFYQLALGAPLSFATGDVRLTFSIAGQSLRPCRGAA